MVASRDTPVRLTVSGLGGDPLNIFLAKGAKLYVTSDGTYLIRYSTLNPRKFPPTETVGPGLKKICGVDADYNDAPHCTVVIELENDKSKHWCNCHEKTTPLDTPSCQRIGLNFGQVPGVDPDFSTVLPDIAARTNLIRIFVGCNDNGLLENQLTALYKYKQQKFEVFLAVSGDRNCLVNGDVYSTVKRAFAKRPSYEKVEITTLAVVNEPENLIGPKDLCPIINNPGLRKLVDQYGVKLTISHTEAILDSGYFANWYVGTGAGDYQCEGANNMGDLLDVFSYNSYPINAGFAGDETEEIGIDRTGLVGSYARARDLLMGKDTTPPSNMNVALSKVAEALNKAPALLSDRLSASRCLTRKVRGVYIGDTTS